MNIEGTHYRRSKPGELNVAGEQATWTEIVENRDINWGWGHLGVIWGGTGLFHDTLMAVVITFTEEDDKAEGIYEAGRLRLAYECNPIAFLVEQAGGAASTGLERILEIEPTGIHQRAPLIFGSLHEVHLIDHYYKEFHPVHERSQLFGDRGLFKTG